MNVAVQLWILSILIICSFEFCSSNAATQEEKLPIVKTKLGDIRGRNMTTRLEQPFLSFRAIRYAEAPVDELRFQVHLYYTFIQ